MAKKSRKKTKSRSRNPKISKWSPSTILLLAALTGLALLAAVSLSQTVKQRKSLNYDKPESLFSSQGSVLGEEDDEGKEQEEKEEEKNEDQKKEEERKNEDQKKQEEQQKELKSSGSSSVPSGQKDSGGENVTTAPLKIKKQTEGKKQETEIESPGGQKIKTKIEDDGRTKIEIEHGDLKIKYEIRNGQVVKKVEDDEGNEVELDDDELETLEDELEQELEDDDIQIASNTPRPTVVKNNIAAITEFPLSVDVGTNQLILTTPGGQKILTVLPDQAVENLLATGIVNSISSVNQGSTEGIENLKGLIELKVRNGEPVYEIEGTKRYRFLTFIPIDQPLKAVLSAETGNVLTTQKSFLTNFIDLLSP